MVALRSVLWCRSTLTGLILLAAVMLGCQSLRKDRTLGMQHHARASADAPIAIPPGVVLINPADFVVGLREPRHILALSSGGLYGAYTAGVLDGWTRTGTRPEFDVVTGASTGALIAPFAFLGPEYDARAMQLYTGVQTEDLYRIRSWVTIPFRESIADTAPFKALIEKQIDQELMNRIVAEHKKGRRLYVATTDLRTRRAVIWDMGAIASRGYPEGYALFRDVLLASAAIPGVFPPVAFKVEVDGCCEVELHADGGITAPLFVPPGVLAAAHRAAGPNPKPMPGGPHLYVIVAGKLYPEPAPVRPRILPVLAATSSAVFSAQTRAELANLYWQSRVYGMRYHMLALRQDATVNAQTPLNFDPQVMTKLYEEGLADGLAGPRWRYAPPALSPCDGDFPRDGLRLRTVPVAHVFGP